MFNLSVNVFFVGSVRLLERYFVTLNLNYFEKLNAHSALIRTNTVTCNCRYCLIFSLQCRHTCFRVSTDLLNHRNQSYFLVVRQYDIVDSIIYFELVLLPVSPICFGICLRIHC